MALSQWCFFVRSLPSPLPWVCSLLRECRSHAPQPLVRRERLDTMRDLIRDIEARRVCRLPRIVFPRVGRVVVYAFLARGGHIVGLTRC